LTRCKLFPSGIEYLLGAQGLASGQLQLEDIQATAATAHRYAIAVGADDSAGRALVRCCSGDRLRLP
jgi:hypothetical protein